MTVPGTTTGRERAGSAPGPGGGRGTRAASGSMRRAALPRAGGIWLAAGVFALLFFAAAAPSPLYGVYQAQWRVFAAPPPPPLPPSPPLPPGPLPGFWAGVGLPGPPPGRPA